MDLAFLTAKLKDICEKRAKAISILGEHAALELEQRLADLNAAQTVGELITLFGEMIMLSSSSEWIVNLESGYKLVFCAGHVKIPCLETGETDWDKVTRIKIVDLKGPS